MMKMLHKFSYSKLDFQSLILFKCLISSNSFQKFASISISSTKLEKGLHKKKTHTHTQHTKFLPCDFQFFFNMQFSYVFFHCFFHFLNLGYFMFEDWGFFTFLHTFFFHYIILNTSHTFSLIIFSFSKD